MKQVNGLNVKQHETVRSLSVVVNTHRLGVSGGRCEAAQRA